MAARGHASLDWQHDGGEKTRAHSRVSTLVRPEEYQNILIVEFLTNWPRSVRSIFVLITPASLLPPVSLQCKCPAAPPSQWKIDIIMAKHCWQLFIEASEIYEKEILHCFNLTIPAHSEYVGLLHYSAEELFIIQISPRLSHWNCL